MQEICEIIRELENPDLEKAAIHHFWKMFVLDYLIGNCDRHLENWGMVIDRNGRRYPSPVYDCGSSLLAVTSDEQLQEEIGTGDFTGKSLNLYTPFGTEDNRRRLSFRDVLESPNPELEQAILEVFPRIDLAGIYQILQDTPFMSEIRKTAMMESIKIRYNQVLLKAWVKAAHPALSDHEQKRLISRIKSASNARMRKRGYHPLSEA
nr:HipA domain-containing protein [uncultured Faecalibaculum sp.]